MNCRETIRVYREPLAILLLTAALFPFLSGWLPIVRFTAERIDIDVFPDHIQVKGTYAYRNPLPFPVVQGFSYPLPVDENHPPPVLLSAERIAPRPAPISLKRVMGKERFDLSFKSGEEIRVVVRYRQQAPRQSGRYILTTTKPWRRPLEHATYRIIPNGVDITDSNYHLSSIQSGGLGFDRTGFMPAKDWVFTWEKAK